jgi:large subunit ribosomal protein L2
MGLKKFNPITPGTRFKVADTFSDVTTSTPEKSLLVSNKKSGGRNHSGKMTMRYIGGGSKQRYRLIDFRRDKHGIEAKVATIEYDPNRSGRIALLQYVDGEKRYILAPDKLEVGRTVLSGENAPVEPGNALFLKDIPLGTMIHHIEMRPGQGAVLVRSAGVAAQLQARDGKYAIIRMPSGEIRLILNTCLAVIGTVSNSDHRLVRSGKAGRSRWLGRRPRVRGVAMNPVDHPMGGGEGRASGGHPRSRKGIPAKGYKTRAPKNRSSKYILERRKK